MYKGSIKTIVNVCNKLFVKAVYIIHMLVIRRNILQPEFTE